MHYDLKHRDDGMYAIGNLHGTIFTENGLEIVTIAKLGKRHVSFVDVDRVREILYPNKHDIAFPIETAKGKELHHWLYQHPN